MPSKILVEHLGWWQKTGQTNWGVGELLGFGFNMFQSCFIFTPIWGKEIQFDEHIFQMGWFIGNINFFQQTIFGAHDSDGLKFRLLKRRRPLERWGSSGANGKMRVSLGAEDS